MRCSYVPSPPLDAQSQSPFSMSLWTCLLWAIHINRVTECDLKDLSSLTKYDLHMCCCCSHCLYFIPSFHHIIFHCMDIPHLFVCLSLHRVFFPFLAFLNLASLKFCFKSHIDTCSFFSVICVDRELLGFIVILFLTFWDTARFFFFFCFKAIQDFIDGFNLLFN